MSRVQQHSCGRRPQPEAGKSPYRVADNCKKWLDAHGEKPLTALTKHGDKSPLRIYRIGQLNAAQRAQRHLDLLEMESKVRDVSTGNDEQE